MKTIAFGGVRDGEVVDIPAGAEPNQFTMKLSNKGQDTTYVLRQAGAVRSLVAQGVKWPILGSAAA